jgi:hypothetical protein
MRNKNIISVGLTLVLAVWNWCVQASVLNVKEHYQEMDQWCWSATCQATIEFYGITQSQTVIANYGTGGANVWNYLWGSGSHDGVFCRGCNQILNQFASVVSTGTSAAMPISQLQSEIDAFRPVVVNWAWDSGGGHILLAYGITGSNVFLMDPYYGPSVNNYDWVCKGSSHTWAWTLRLTTSSLAINGVPRWWLGNFGLTNNWDTSALADQDQDGVPTWKEYFADTNPTNAQSYFHIQSVSKTASATVFYQSSTNRKYSLYYTTNLTSGGWIPISIQTNISGSGNVDSLSDTADGESQRFYRIGVALP